MLRKGISLDLARDDAVRNLDRADDRALALAIAGEVLRRLPDLDALIDRATPKRLADETKARALLRIALVQMLRLDTPPHAAIATILPLIEGGARRLVHAVLSRVLREGWTLPEIPSLPAAAERRWRKAWGDGMVRDAGRLIAEPPPLDLIFASGEVPPEWDGISLAPGHLRLPRGQAVAGLTGYGEGGWWVQDLAASIPARMFGAGDGREALDLCAAPGGKTMQLAAAGWAVTAVDLSESRLARLSENLERTRLQARVIAADVMKWQPDGPVDAILLDAPCSATGIFRRHPDVLHRVEAGAIAGLARAQLAMLDRASGWLRPGGSLVYSVCSLEPEEGEGVARAFLAGHPDYRQLEEQRLLPGTYIEAGGADGFFIARFERTEA